MTLLVITISVITLVWRERIWRRRHREMWVTLWNLPNLFVADKADIERLARMAGVEPDLTDRVVR